MKKQKSILTEAELKLIKSILFVQVALAYGLLMKFSNGWLTIIVFGALLWMYLREIYGGRR